MTVFSLLAVVFIMKVVAVLFIICCLALILIILIQKGKGGGLSAAFGGAMAGGILGSKTGDFLTWVTIVLVGIFLTLAVIMGKFYKPSVSDFGETTPAQQAPLTGSEEPSSSVGFEDITSDANLANDVNSTGG
jgi:preprotein translocase subunit SecG